MNKLLQRFDIDFDYATKASQQDMMMSQNAGNNFEEVEQEQAESAHDMNKNEHMMQ